MLLTKQTSNMKKLNILVLIALLFTASISCAQTRQAKDEFDVSNFTAIKSTVVANIEVRQSSQTNVMAEGNEDMLNLLEVSMDKNTLVLNMRDRKRWRIKNNTNKLTIYVSTPTLTQIDSEGVGNITIVGNFNTPELKIESDGVGNIKAENIIAGEVRIDSEGVGNISIAGNATSVNISSQGVGNIDAEKLKTPRANVSSEGVGNVSCYASEYLKVSSAGIGNVTYYGNPKETNLNKDGVGKIRAGK